MRSGTSPHHDRALERQPLERRAGESAARTTPRGDSTWSSASRTALGADLDAERQNLHATR